MDEEDENKFLEYLSDVLRRKGRVVMPAEQFNTNIEDIVNSRLPNTKILVKSINIKGDPTLEERREAALGCLRELYTDVINQKLFTITESSSTDSNTHMISVGFGIVTRKEKEDGSAREESKAP